MNYLHEENVLHRDLTSRNILLTKHMQAKVADFGLSKKNLEDTDLSYTMGSVAWMAPEVIASARQFNKKADVYSFGVICWELFSGTDPCPEDMAHINLANKVLHEEWRPTIPDNVPSLWTQLIKQCWSQKTPSRPSFSEILGILDSIEPFPMGPMESPPQEDPKEGYPSLIQLERQSLMNLQSEDSVETTVMQTNTDDHDVNNAGTDYSHDSSEDDVVSADAVS